MDTIIITQIRHRLHILPKERFALHFARDCPKTKSISLQALPEHNKRPLIAYIPARGIDAPRTGNISGACGLYSYRLKIISGSRCNFLNNAVRAMN